MLSNTKTKVSGKDFFKEIQRTKGESVVWMEDSKANFSISYRLVDDYYDIDEIRNLHDRLNSDRHPNLNCYVNYSDDVMNLVVVQDLNQLTEEEIKFLSDYAGDNCYNI